jgi:DNA-binding transcriptional ArsR family regulator
VEAPLTLIHVTVFHRVQQASGWVTVSQIARATGIPVATVGIHCKKLTEDGILDRELMSRTYRYRLAPDTARTGDWLRLQETVAALGL